MVENTRELAVTMLLEIAEQNKYSHLVIRNVLDKYDYMDGRDKAFLKRITEGTLERKIQIDYVLDRFSGVPVSRMRPFIRNLLRVSVYQMLFMDNVPERAVCNEAVKLAGKRGFGNLRGFVNGVLRNIARGKDKIRWPDEEENTAACFSVRYSMPEWLVEKFLSERGASQTKKILESFLAVSPVTVRTKESLREEEREALLNEMKKSGVRAIEHPYLPYAYRIWESEGVRALPGYEEGLFMVQDVSGMLVCEAAGIKEGDRVIDVCASPGGKALHAAEKLRGTGFVSARDLTEYKAEAIRDNIRRMHAQNVETLVFDARQLRREDVETADVLLCDLPCSGLGIIGKKADIKYHASEEEFRQLKELQREILGVVWQYVKRGGVLIYSTCTINPDENEENVKWFTAHFPFHTEALSPFLPERLKEEGTTGMLQLLPGIHETDGFFLARLRREE